MNKVYYLHSCNTCLKIIKSLPENHNLQLQEIKNDPISKEDLHTLKNMSGSYETLFSKKAQLYKTLELRNKDLLEDDFKNYILKHYTFLKRPVFVINGKVLIGNSKDNIANVLNALKNV